MENTNTICPICTLYLREGISLQAHLDTHPKEKVIEALLKISNGGNVTTSNSATTLPYDGSNASLQTFTNSHSSFLSNPYVNPPQSQMTTAVTYQHFISSNGSTILPQYIQVPSVINSNNNLPVMPNQAMNFIPNQTVNYSQNIYNPMYNPYIPHPYPFQPFYSNNLPTSALPPDDSFIQTNNVNENSSALKQSGQVMPITQSSTAKKKTTSVGATKSIRRRKILKKSVLRFSGQHRKRRIFRAKTNDSSSSLSVIKSPLKGKSGVSNKSSSATSKRSVINLPIPKITLGNSSKNSNIKIMPKPPITFIPEDTINTQTDCKTSPLHPPSFSNIPSSNNFIKKENVQCDFRSRSMSSEIINDTCDNNEEFDEGVHLNSVIVESSSLQNTNTELKDCQDLVKNVESEASCIQQIMKSVIINLESENDLPVENTKDPLSFEDAEEEVDDSANDKLVDNYNDFESQEVMEEVNDDKRVEKEEEENIFQIIEIGEESKIKISDANLNDCFSDGIFDKNFECNHQSSSEFTTNQKINIVSNKSVSENNRDQSSYSEFVLSCSSNLQNKHCENVTENRGTIENNFYSNNYCESVSMSNTSNIIEKPSVKSNAFHSVSFGDALPVTYNDLQPVNTSKVFQNIGLNGPNVNLGKNANGNNLSELLKTENSNVLESVIHLVSGNNETKNVIDMNEKYVASTSQANENHLDISNMSPIGLNIQADESMPARGELSEQESLGAENSTWNLFHNAYANDTKILQMWRNADNPQVISVIECKKNNNKKFKCSVCGEIFSCAKERRVHKNAVHTNKEQTTPKKVKNYACNYCEQVFLSIRDRKTHVVENHFTELKQKKNTSQSIKQEKPEPETNDGPLEKLDASVKNEIVGEGGENGVKLENPLPAPESESPRVKYCSQCRLPCQGIKKLREHQRLEHGKVHFKCETCSQCFDEETDYNDHLLIHPLVCDKCGKTFHKKANLNLHMKRHLETRPYECPFCPKSFITRQKLEEHKNGHSGKKPLKCGLCDKTFSRHSNLIQHKNLHHLNVKKKIKDFVCRCGEVFHSLRKLEWHKEVHEPNPKPCPFCSRKFIHSASVTRHIRRAHMPDYLPGDNREYDNVNCPVCDKVYLRSSLAVHLRVHNGEKPFPCKICNKKFSTKWNLELHNWTHQSRNDMPFKCDTCKSAFFRESDFVSHLNSHKNHKPYTCNVCGQKFIRKYSCLRHQEEHKKSKQFVCAVSGCAKSFHRGYYLRDHMKIHSGVRPHTCHICGKASSTKSNHNKHVRIHDTREPINTEN
ncbi:conserved hypothetical protein [Pediculus humanus corporis]|uniref:C2H2-type domain-containing protein n=1 Tax=Pediculus humanus subsp. corporis TaxID=121224 RepID=E0VU58_PEDHC|nr:uncharacterized protein Phum_PHUM446260 [Pediculus humanus corporis]EEB16914.1 conserved hypothetical protein [Pediculus humanus corporis]